MLPRHTKNANALATVLCLLSTALGQPTLNIFSYRCRCSLLIICFFCNFKMSYIVYLLAAATG